MRVSLVLSVENSTNCTYKTRELDGIMVTSTYKEEQNMSYISPPIFISPYLPLKSLVISVDFLPHGKLASVETD